MVNILVTGGYGFIGSAFIRQCLDTESCNILNIDSMTYAANKFNLRGYEESENYSFLELDICDLLSMQEVIRDFRPTWIVNFAAESHVDNSISSPETFIKTNIDGVLSAFHILPILLPEGVNRNSVIEYCKQKGIQTSIHYPAFWEFTAYKNQFDKNKTPKALNIIPRELTLPLYPNLTINEVDLVSSAILDACL